MEDLTIGAFLIAQERDKQIQKHGFTAEHHANHPEWYEKGQLIQASQEILNGDSSPTTPDNWDQNWFKNLTERPKKERLIIAGALIAAELDRLELIEKKCFIDCTSCDKDFDIEIMNQDSDENYFCPQCWTELSPIMKKDWEYLNAKGEV